MRKTMAEMQQRRHLTGDTLVSAPFACSPVAVGVVPTESLARAGGQH